MLPAVVAPPEGTVERWAWDYVRSEVLEHKLAPPEPPQRWEPEPPTRRIPSPGRPPELEVSDRSARTPRPGALVRPRARAQLLATFLHHELQAAELMCWALLAFPDTPRAFRSGLVRICLDEIRHMRLYAEHMHALGFAVGDFPVRDWFWERVPTCRSPVDYVAVMGMGLEGGNLDHTQTFAERFRDVGDEDGAELQELVGREEIGHVRFALHWFERWTGQTDFDTWVEHLPSPLSPMLMRGRPVRRAPRLRAGLGDAFIDRLDAWQPTRSPPGS